LVSKLAEGLYAADFSILPQKPTKPETIQTIDTLHPGQRGDAVNGASGAVKPPRSTRRYLGNSGRYAVRLRAGDSGMIPGCRPPRLQTRWKLTGGIW
jgi:hypothetical protein